jgi:hypothetical protein
VIADPWWNATTIPLNRFILYKTILSILFLHKSTASVTIGGSNRYS